MTPEYVTFLNLSQGSVATHTPGAV